MTQRDYSGWATQTSYGVEETAYGTKSGTINLPFGKVISCGVKADAPVIEHRSKSSGRNVGKKVAGRVSVAGSVEFCPQNGLFLQYALGELRKGAMGDGTAVPVAASDANEVVSGCNLTETTPTPDMNLNLAAAGSYDIATVNYTTTALSDIAIGAAHATLPRVDIVSIKDATGTTNATVTPGTAAASPVPDWASVAVDELAIALVWVGAAVTKIYTADVRQIFWAKETNLLTGTSNYGISIENDFINPEGTASDDIINYYLGCKVNELIYSVSREQTDPIKFVANFIGKKPQTNVSGASASSITDFLGAMFLEWDTEIEIANGTNYDLNDYSFSINNNLKTRGTDGRYISKLVPGVRTYKATAKIDLLDKNEIERFYGALTYSEPQDTIGDFIIKHTLKKPEYERIEFKFTGCTYNKADTSDPLDDLIQQDLEINISSCTVMMVEGTETY